ncbi:hypothetical protein HDU98_000888 [Podochytrium sp. JEL0797]|nr:hypothetical protein HDU98_000888 [Podochytrium sp. JEL0797]
MHVDTKDRPPIESPSSDPYFFVQYALVLPMYCFGALLNFAAAYGIARGMSLEAMPRVQRLFVLLVILSLLWSLYQISVYVINLYYGSDLFSLVNSVMMLVWLEFVLWFNTALAMERFFHVRKLRDQESRKFFAILLILFLGCLAAIVWAATLPSLNYPVLWKYIIPSSLLLTSVITTVFYRLSINFAHEKLCQTLSPTDASISSAVERKIKTMTRQIIKNSLIMSLSLFVCYFPQVLLLFLASLGVGGFVEGYYGIILCANVLAGLDPVVTGLLALYFLKGARLYLFEHNATLGMAPAAKRRPVPQRRHIREPSPRESDHNIFYNTEFIIDSYLSMDDGPISEVVIEVESPTPDFQADFPIQLHDLEQSLFDPELRVEMSSELETTDSVPVKGVVSETATVPVDRSRLDNLYEGLAEAYTASHLSESNSTTPSVVTSVEGSLTGSKAKKKGGLVHAVRAFTKKQDADTKADALNPHNRLALPLESSVIITPRSIQTWLGPKASLAESAQASAEASAVASATRATNAFATETAMLALFAKGVNNTGLILVKYKAIDCKSFVLTKKAQRKDQVDIVQSIEESAKSTTVKITLSKISKKLKKMKRAIHENVTEFLFAAVSTCADPKVNPQPSNGRKGKMYASEFYIALGYCERGTLEDALCGLRFPLPSVIKLALCRDLFSGLQYLHKYRPHGKLNSRVCYITDGWRLKIFPGNFDSFTVAEKAPQSTSFDIYEKYATRLFASPDEIERYPKNFKSKAGDIYSAGLIVNMIMNDGARPFFDHSNFEDLIQQLPQDDHSLIRPTLPREPHPKILKIIQDAWSYYPENRPAIADVLTEMSTLLQELLPPKNKDVELHLSKIYAQEIHAYLLELERAQSHLTSNLSETVAKKLAESEQRLQNVRVEYQRQIQGLQDQLGRTLQNVDVQASHLGRETDQMMSKVKAVEQTALSWRLGLLPDPLAKLLTEGITSIKLSKGETEVPHELDQLFRPTVFPNATIMVVSIAGFNRYISQLSNTPKLLIEILKSYYKAIDEATEASGGKVHCVDRITDACVLVAGAMEKDNKSAAHAVDVGIKLIEWAMHWDASKLLSGSNARLMLRIGVHTGPVLGGLIGKIPRLLLMGESLNTATMIETTCGVQELRISAFTHAQILSSGEDDRFVFESKEEIEIKQKGKMAVFKVILDLRET